MKHYLVVSKPYPIVCNGECEDVVHKRLTLRVVARGGKCLQQENFINTLNLKKVDKQPIQLSNKDKTFTIFTAGYKQY